MTRKSITSLIILLVFAMASLNGNALADANIPDVIPENELVLATYGEPALLDPAMNYETAGGSIIQQIYDPLLTLEREKVDTYVPMLATGWEISPEKDVYTFTIRQGVTFHNGNTLTPEDVAYTFQRSILQGGHNSPQWLFTEALLGYGINDICEIIDDVVCDNRNVLQAYQELFPAEVENACLTIKNAIQADADAGTVTFHLAQPWSPLLSTLVGQWGSIVDKEWAVSIGAWDGDCATWQDHYNAYTDNPLASIANGTGPYSLDHWTEGEEIVLARNPHYWRTEPMWEGGPSGPTMFDTFTRKIEADASTRVDMLLNHDSDWIPSDLTRYDELEDQVLYSYSDAAGVEPTLVHPTGTLKLYKGGYAGSATDVMFNYNIKTDGVYNYIGSGALDGYGIPVDFFSDIHVRKAFNYAFDWDEYSGGSLGDTTIQRSGPIIYGLPGYDSTQPKYSYNPSEALNQINQAWGGLVGTNGFSVTLVYNLGNTDRLKVAEILKENIEALNPNFHIEILGLDWTTFLNEQRAERLPIFIQGWSQDIPHPHNWVVPYLGGVFANSQDLPQELVDKYTAKITACLALEGDDARLCYEDIQTSTYDDAIDIFLTQSLTRSFVRAELQGYYVNPAKSGLISYYPLSKGALPVVETIDPLAVAAISANSTTGAVLTADIPAGAVDTAISLSITPDIPVFDSPPDYKLGDISFEIQAFDTQGILLDTLELNEPVLFTIYYTDDQIRILDETTLTLFRWDGTDWIDAACGDYIRDISNNSLQVPICHFSDFALGGISYTSYLPFISK